MTQRVTWSRGLYRPSGDGDSTLAVPWLSFSGELHARSQVRRKFNLWGQSQPVLFDINAYDDLSMSHPYRLVRGNGAALDTALT